MHAETEGEKSLQLRQQAEAQVKVVMDAAAPPLSLVEMQKINHEPEGMTGLELAKKLRAKQPNLKVIITSGYNAEMVVEGRPTSDGIRYLQKPYQIEVLSKVVRVCLDRGQQ